jgi:NAD(P)-dependent dehydrogenase (short-subunit alcohol dehydrogenase family)
VGAVEEERLMTIENKAVLITGANRGIGQALVEEALQRGARRVYAGTRGELKTGEKRVTPLGLDVTTLRRSSAPRVEWKPSTSSSTTRASPSTMI